MQDKLLEVIRDDATARIENTEALKDLTSALRKRPCMAAEAVDAFVKEHGVVIKRLLEIEQLKNPGKSKS